MEAELNEKSQPEILEAIEEIEKESHNVDNCSKQSEQVFEIASQHSSGKLVQTPRRVTKRKGNNEDQEQSSSSKITKKSQTNEVNFLSSALNQLQDITNRATQVTVQRDDGYDHFGRYVASLLRTIGLPQAVKLQQQITTMLTNAVCPSENLLSEERSRSVAENSDSCQSANVFSPSFDDDYSFLNL